MSPDDILPPPLPNPFSWALHRYFPGFAAKIDARCLNAKVVRCRANYARQFWRVRRKFNSGKQVNVLFVVSETAKWKCASVYWKLQQDKRFNVSIGVAPPESLKDRTINGIVAQYNANCRWFSERGYECVALYNPRRDKAFRLRKFTPDIVFYTSAWYDVRKQQPDVASRTALTFYIPYFVPNYVDVSLDCRLDAHRLYWRHIVLNSDLARIYSESTADRRMAGRFVALGHPMLDLIAKAALSTKHDGRRKLVVYAPHWTIDVPGHKTQMKLSTFTANGRFILDYARSHREFDWAFKPHPRLYRELSEVGFMTRDEVDEYYGEWASLGKVCTDGDYAALFAMSDLMITDCGSFLSEYGSTGKPIIHLVSGREEIVPPRSIANVYDTYYRVRDNEELAKCLETVLEKGLDSKAKDRQLALQKASFANSNAADNIYNCLYKIIAPAHSQG